MIAVANPVRKAHFVFAWLPLTALPWIAFFVARDAPSWVLMWSLAVSVFASLKWLTFIDQKPGSVPWGRALGYLLAWPGLDARSFLLSTTAERPHIRDWFFAAAKTLLGAAMLGTATALPGSALMACIGLIGISLVLHFGLFHLLSLCWRQAGVDAPPIMNWPILASSAGDFWGRRWNRAFRDLANRYIFRRLVGRIGMPQATMAVFLASGLIHDLVISLPAGGGYGLPTAYFVMQGLAILAEHSRFGRRIGLRDGLPGRAFCLAVVVGPLPLLFHSAFLERVMVPMLR